MPLVKRVGKLEEIYLYSTEKKKIVGSVAADKACGVSLDFGDHIKMFTNKDLLAGKCRPFLDYLAEDSENED